MHKSVLSQLAKYEIGVINFSEEELVQLDQTHTFLEFTGEPDEIHHESSEIIKTGLPSNVDTIYFLLLTDNNVNISKIMETIPSDEIRNLDITKKIGIYKVPRETVKFPLKLIMIFKN